MIMDIIVDRYLLDIGDILKNGTVTFQHSGKITNVSYNIETGTISFGSGVMDEYIDKETQVLISGRIKSALLEIEKMLSGFRDITDGNYRPEFKYY